MSEEFDFECIKNKAIEQLKDGKSLLGKDGVFAPLLESILNAALESELDALDALLDSSVRLLGQGGRMAVITFHSLEDRRVKQFFDLRSRPEIDRPEWPAPRPNPDYCFRPLSRKPVTAGEEELSTNPRSRSAKLRGVEKII